MTRSCSLVTKHTREPVDAGPYMHTRTPRAALPPQSARGHAQPAPTGHRIRQRGSNSTPRARPLHRRFTALCTRETRRTHNAGSSHGSGAHRRVCTTPAHTQTNDPTRSGGPTGATRRHTHTASRSTTWRDAHTLALSAAEEAERASAGQTPARLCLGERARVAREGKYSVRPSFGSHANGKLKCRGCVRLASQDD